MSCLAATTHLNVLASTSLVLISTNLWPQIHSVPNRYPGKSMSVSLSHLSWWLWSGKQQQEPKRLSSGSSLNSSQDSGLWEPDALKFPLVKGANMTSTPRRIKRKWQSREERKIDREYDVVIVPSDAGCISGSESDDSDWSIGWLEPHGPEFHSDDESDSSFAVLVPCYGRGRNDVLEDSHKKIFGTIGNFPDGYSADNRKYMEQWLSSLRSS